MVGIGTMLVDSVALQAPLDEAVALVIAEDKIVLKLSVVEDWLTALLLIEEGIVSVVLGVLLLMLEDEMAVEPIAVDSGEMVAPNPAVDELGWFTLIGVDSEMLVASKEGEASATEDDAAVVNDVTNSASVTDG
jgi:hypothetical protein